MKRSTILIVVLLCSAFSSSAQEIDKLAVITVSGTAAAVGQTIGRAIKITEGNVGGQTFANYSANSNAIGTAGVFTESLVTFAPGAIKIEAQVTVSFLLN